MGYLYAILTGILLINLIIMFKMRELLKWQQYSVSSDESMLEALERLKEKQILDDVLYEQAKGELLHKGDRSLIQDEKILLEHLYECKMIDAIELDEKVRALKHL